MSEYLKIPCELANFALQARKVGQLQCYTASHLLYSGKARRSDRPAYHIAQLTGKTERTVYRYFDWLVERDWFGHDKRNGWYFFRGFDRVYEMEGWKWRRAAVIQKKDIDNFKAFCIGAVLASIVKTGRGAGTEQPTGRSLQAGHPVSLSFIQKVLNVSQKTAFTYRKLAKNNGFIKMRPDLQQIKGLTVNDLRYLRESDQDSVTVNLFGSSDSINVHPKQLVIDNGNLCVQLPNIITPCIALQKRK